MNRKQYTVLAVLFLLFLAALIAGVGGLWDLGALRNHERALVQWAQDQPIESKFLFFIFYVGIACLPIPGISIFSMAGGAIFGVFWGSVLVSFAAATGATCTFMLSRLLFKDTTQNKLEGRLKGLHAEVSQRGIIYLLSLRLLPLIPFFAINWAMGVTAMRARTFYLVTQLGCLTSTVIYANAGAHLSQVNTVSDVLNPVFMLSLAILALLPILVRRLQMGRKSDT